MASGPVIDKLLSTVIQIKASDLHITVGQPPVVRHQGRMRRLDAKNRNLLLREELQQGALVTGNLDNLTRRSQSKA